MRVLVVGAGIAGSTVAYWLQKAGHQPTLLERSHRLRRGGYLIDFLGTGFDVAERMDLVPRLRREGYPLAEARDVALDGHRIASLDPPPAVRCGNKWPIRQHSAFRPRRCNP
ncbi:FAD-dependent oxidoreductase [Brevibacterium aurantiacum]|uniref:FAD-dependent oxidoreductase n=1 Tax=Brevibacterium aurantiacum TaxID=273384 RepID=UPI001D016208|nr:FAD-dependent oxidoreductase [Brevibacterium aurantiacum]